MQRISFVAFDRLPATRLSGLDRLRFTTRERGFPLDCNYFIIKNNVFMFVYVKIIIIVLGHFV